VLNKSIDAMNTCAVKYISIYYNEIHKLIDFNNYDKIITLFNPYIYIYSNITGTNISVSKLKANSLLFYDLIEINSTIDLFSFYKKINILNIGLYKNDFEYYANMMLENVIEFDSYLNIESTNLLENINNKYDFIYLDVNTEINTEINNNLYINNIIKSLAIILNCQSNEGTCVIKIDNLFYKPIVEFLYLLSSFFDKVYIIKPYTTNYATSEKYVVCKNFLTTKLIKINNVCNLTINASIFENLNDTVITSILNKAVPCYFLNKIHDLNSILVQQQLEAMETLINILKAKDKTEKFELLKKNNIIKSTLWCEKYKIPYNKFIEKTNIFLPILKNEDEDAATA
jgi:hypothetical protein